MGEREKEEETFRYTRIRFTRVSRAYEGTGKSMRLHGDSHTNLVQIAMGFPYRGFFPY